MTIFSVLNYGFTLEKKVFMYTPSILNSVEETLLKT